MPLRNPPLWWDWKLAFTRHVERRMLERGISEVELRAMLKWARGFRPSAVEGRFVVETSHAGRNWEVVVEPDDELECITLVTVYASE